MKKRILPALFTQAAKRLHHWPAAAASLACIALVERFTIRDRFPFLSAIYYATPPHLIALLITVDMISNLLASRERAFARVYQAFTPLLADPLLVMGDFNTPTDSIYLAPWREKLLNGFESAGRGCSATWPTLLPVQAIDQVWFNRKLDVSHFLLHNTLLSDHRMVTFEIATANDVNTLKDYHDRASDRNRD